MAASMCKNLQHFEFYGSIEQTLKSDCSLLLPYFLKAFKTNMEIENTFCSQISLERLHSLEIRASTREAHKTLRMASPSSLP